MSFFQIKISNLYQIQKISYIFYIFNSLALININIIINFVQSTFKLLLKEFFTFFSQKCNLINIMSAQSAINRIHLGSIKFVINIVTKEIIIISIMVFFHSVPHSFDIIIDQSIS